MKFKLTMSCDNAAFEGDNLSPEIGDILRAVEGQLLNGETSGTCFDVNGNKVGMWELK